MKKLWFLLWIWRSVVMASVSSVTAPFVPTHDPILRMNAEEIKVDEISSTKVQDVVNRLFASVNGAEGKKTVGLAAPQIGISCRVIVVDVAVGPLSPEKSDLRAYINPKITWMSDEQVEGKEGCCSVDRHIVGIVKRAKCVEVNAYDRDGNFISELFEDYTARIFQHEIDHLDGILFPDRVGQEGVLHWVPDGQEAEYKKSWQNWPIRLPWSTWLDIEAGRPFEFTPPTTLFESNSAN
jgi:peptide deformylase